jgi:hypothetical protein
MYSIAMIPWELIKNHWRNEFRQTEIYTDENEHIIVFKIHDTYVLIAFYYYDKCSWMSADRHIDFIDWIKKLGFKSYNPFKIYLLCNCRLSRIKKSNAILSLPNDVEYFYVDYNSFYETIELKLEDQIESAKQSQIWEQIYKPWHHKKGIPIINDSKFDNWDKWTENGYRREWYNWNENERFDYFFDQNVSSVAEWYIDDSKLMGFYIVWKW